jgi:hypothetical protein
MRFFDAIKDVKKKVDSCARIAFSETVFLFLLARNEGILGR